MVPYDDVIIDQHFFIFSVMGVLETISKEFPILTATGLSKSHILTPLFVELFRENINMCLHFPSSPAIGILQISEIHLPR